MTDHTWRSKANCIGMGTNWFFVGSGSQTEATALARAVCADCRVNAECLDHALHYEGFGIWAGTSEGQRRRLRKERDIEFHAPSTEEFVVQACGTRRGVTRHYRAGEPLCESCRRANNLARAEQKSA